MVPSLEKTKFGRKAIEDMESMGSVDEVIDLEALMINPYFFKLFYYFSNISNSFQVKKKHEEDLVEVEGKHPTTEEDLGHSGVTIKSSKGDT